MKITIMVGNGLDIGLGIASSYSDFYEWYCRRPSTNNTIQQFKNNIWNDIHRDAPNDEKTWSDFEAGLGQYTSEFTKETGEKFLECFEDAQEAIVKYLDGEYRKFDPYLFTSNSFASFEKGIYDYYGELADQEKDAVKKSINAVIHEDHEISFISFNYTFTLEEVLEKIPLDNIPSWRVGSVIHRRTINQEVIHVNGSMQKYPVIGVNDESQIANKDLLDIPSFKDSVIKPRCVNALGELWHAKAEAQIDSSRIICIFGMSIGKTDAKWWKKLALWLKASESRHLIIYWYEKQLHSKTAVMKRIRCINKVKDLFLSYSTLSMAEKEAVRMRIHIIVNTDRFLCLPNKIMPLPTPFSDEALSASEYKKGDMPISG